MISFPEFEWHIDKKILDRGFDYYEYDHVDDDFEIIDQGEFSTTVHGSEDYNVYVKIEGNYVTSHSCDCPYDWGDVCKHIVAVLYYIRDAEMHKEHYFTTTINELKTVFSTVNDAELREFIFQYARSHKQFRENLLSEFR